jgi:hypothetical protein
MHCESPDAVYLPPGLARPLLATCSLRKQVLIQEILHSSEWEHNTTSHPLCQRHHFDMKQELPYQNISMGK